MMPTLERPSERTADRYAPAAEALLIDQLARATRELRAKEAQGSRSQGIAEVICSLRLTLVTMAEKGTTPDLARVDVAVVCTDEGDLELRSRGEKLPVRTSVLRDCFGRAGVRLQPGQALLADPQLGRRCIEESLLLLSKEEFQIRRSKSALLQVLQSDSAAIQT